MIVIVVEGDPARGSETETRGVTEKCGWENQRGENGSGQTQSWNWN